MEEISEIGTDVQIEDRTHRRRSLPPLTLGIVGKALRLVRQTKKKRH